MTNISNFVSQVKTGGMARTNRYAVFFNAPWGNAGVQKALLFCDQVQLPGVNFNTSDTRTFGETRKAPYEKMYEDINMSFYVDRNMAVKQLFEQWMSQIQNPVTRTFNYYNDYTTDIVIEVQDLNDKTTYSVVLYEAFPKSIGAVQMDYASKDVMKLSVNIAYKYYYAGATQALNEGDSFPQQGGLAGFLGIDPKNDPLNKFVNRLQNFAVGSAGAKLVSSLPNILKR